MHRTNSNPKVTEDEYLLCSSKSMVEAGNISHDSSLIRFGCIHNIYKRRRNKTNARSGKTWPEKKSVR